MEQRSIMSRAQIKERGKDIVREHWGDLLVVLLLYVVGIAVVQLLTIFSGGIGTLVASGPLAVGVLYIYYKASLGEKCEYIEVLRYFKKRFGDIILAMLLSTIIQSVVIIVGAIIVVIMVSLFSFAAANSGSDAMVAMVTIIGYILGIVVLVAWIYAYLGLVMTPYILLREEGAKGKMVVSKSWQMMKGQKGRYFVFMLSFLGWFILAVFTVGILLIWVVPYYFASAVVLQTQIYENSPLAGETEVSFDPRQIVNDIKEDAGRAQEFAAQRQAPPQQTPPADQDVKYCSTCGQQLPATAKFCGNCGSHID